MPERFGGRDIGGPVELGLAATRRLGEVGGVAWKLINQGWRVWKPPALSQPVGSSPELVGGIADGSKREADVVVLTRTSEHLLGHDRPTKPGAEPRITYAPEVVERMSLYTGLTVNGVRENLRARRRVEQALGKPHD